MPSRSNTKSNNKDDFVKKPGRIPDSKKIRTKFDDLTKENP